MSTNTIVLFYIGKKAQYVGSVDTITLLLIEEIVKFADVARKEWV